MSRIDVSEKESNIYDNNTDIFWRYVQRDYNILPEQAISITNYLKQHFAHIVEDNLRGQW